MPPLLGAPGPFDPNKYGKPIRKSSDTTSSNLVMTSSVDDVPSRSQADESGRISNMAGHFAGHVASADNDQTKEFSSEEAFLPAKYDPPQSPPHEAALSDPSPQTSQGSQASGVAILDDDRSNQAQGASSSDRSFESDSSSHHLGAGVSHDHASVSKASLIEQRSIATRNNDVDSPGPDKAITTPKMDDDAATATKPEEGAMISHEAGRRRDPASREHPMEHLATPSPAPTSTGNVNVPAMSGIARYEGPQSQQVSNVLNDNPSWAFSSNVSQAPTSEVPAGHGSGSPSTPVSFLEMKKSQNAGSPLRASQAQTDNHAEQKAHDDSLKLYRKLSPEQKHKMYKKQQEEIFEKTKQVRERKSKGTTSLADLQKARKVPDYDSANSGSVAESSLTLTTITSEKVPRAKEPEAPFNQSRLTTKSSGNAPADTFKETESRDQRVSLGKENQEPKSTSQASQKGNSAVKKDTKPVPKPLDLKDSKWSNAKTRPSPLRNLVKYSETSNKAEKVEQKAPEKVDEKGWPVTTNEVKSKKDSSRWVDASDTRVRAPATKDDVNSNAYASSVPSEGHSSDDAGKPMCYGKLFKQPQDASGDLRNWDGTLAPPPVDWYSRPSFNNNDEAFREHFDSWLNWNLVNTFAKYAEKHTLVIPQIQVADDDLCPDGIDLVSRDHTIDGENCRIYGYGNDLAEEIGEAVHRLRPDDLEDWGKVDMRLEMNEMHNDETADFLVQNYMGHKMIEQKERAITIEQLRKAQVEKSREIMAITTPVVKANIYVRPARREDMSQLAELFNYYIKNSARTTELEPVTSQIMEDRLHTARHDKLPFFVALSRKPVPKKGKKTIFEATHYEKVLGYALAQDFSGVTLAERFTSELELYVHPDWRRKGIGKSLLDKILEVCDPGWLPRQGYSFHCEPDVAHMYGAGGQRDLISLVFVVRHYSNIKANEEPDYPWIKQWLAENFGFKEQGCLQSCSVKHGRL